MTSGILHCCHFNNTCGIRRQVDVRTLTAAVAFRISSSWRPSTFCSSARATSSWACRLWPDIDLRSARLTKTWPQQNANTKLWASVQACMCVCVCTCHTGTCVCVYVSLGHMCVCVRVTWAHVCVCVRVTRAHVCVRVTRAHVCVCVCVCVYMSLGHMCVCVCVCVCTCHSGTCVCVCFRKREKVREREGGGGGGRLNTSILTGVWITMMRYYWKNMFMAYISRTQVLSSKSHPKTSKIKKKKLSTNQLLVTHDCRNKTNKKKRQDRQSDSLHTHRVYRRDLAVCSQWLCCRGDDGGFLQSPPRPRDVWSKNENGAEHTVENEDRKRKNHKTREQQNYQKTFSVEKSNQGITLTQRVYTPHSYHVFPHFHSHHLNNSTLIIAGLFSLQVPMKGNNALFQ